MRVEKEQVLCITATSQKEEHKAWKLFKNLELKVKDVSSFSPGSCTMPTIFRGPNKSGMPSLSLTRLTGGTMHGQGILHNSHR